MRAIDCLARARAEGENYQRPINAFIDAFRRAGTAERCAMLEDPITQNGALEGLIAGVASALCREISMGAPAWVGEIHSPQPFFAFPAKSFELRLRLMIESPPAFRIRNVFVPRDYLARA